MHVPHEVFYFAVFLLSSGLPEAMHLGFSFWRGCDVGVGMLVAWAMRTAVDGDGVATLLVHSVDGVCSLWVILLLVRPSVLSALQATTLETLRSVPGIVLLPVSKVGA